MEKWPPRDCGGPAIEEDGEIGDQKAEILLKEIQNTPCAQAEARRNNHVKSGGNDWQGVEEFFSTDDDSFKDWLKVSWSKPGGTGQRCWNVIGRI